MTTLQYPPDFDKNKFIMPEGLELPTLTWYDDRVESVEDLTPEQEAALQNALDNWNAEWQADQNFRQAVKDLATSAVGVRVDNLTTNQLKAMLAILLFQSGGLNRQLEVKPLKEWVRD